MFSNLDQAVQRLEERGEGVIVAEERPDGKMRYIVETTCYALYSSGAKLHAVNFSYISGATSRLYVDWEATATELYTTQDESNKHASMIREFIATVMNMLEKVGITRHVSWLVENRTRLDPEVGKWKPSFHIYADLWFPNNYEMMPAFVKEAMNRAKLNCHWIDFGVYQAKSLLRMIGVSSKPYHTLPPVEEDSFPMCHTASMSEIADVTTEHMQALSIEWFLKTEEDRQRTAIGAATLESRILQLLKQHGERITILVQANVDSFYGTNSVGRNCLTYPGKTHHAGGNRCIVWVKDEQLWYRCLDPEHKSKTIFLGELFASH
jgi:hypothetical protein